MDITTINSILDKIPIAIVFVRELITGILAFVKLDSYSSIIILLAAFGLAYYWMKQWVTVSLWLKFSTILNLILLALLIFITIVYVK